MLVYCTVYLFVVRFIFCMRMQLCMNVLQVCSALFLIQTSSKCQSYILTMSNSADKFSEVRADHLAIGFIVQVYIIYACNYLAVIDIS